MTVYRGIRVTRSDYYARVPARAANDTSFEFGRFEFKYILPQALRKQIEQAAQDFMVFDPFCASLSGHSYLVNSLYFDDADYSNYYEKIDGVLNRRKFRLRTYSRTSGSAPVFLEEKGRRNNFSYKVRCLVDGAFHDAAANGDWRNLLGRVGSGGTEPLTGFLVNGVRRNLAPRVRVMYRRRPYIAKYGYRFRMTFDDHIEAHLSSSLHSPAQRIRPVLPGRTVLEIKFEDSIPQWFVRLIGMHELNRLSISKYCRAAEALGVVSNLE